jgi:uncharacterized membrane protein YjgN (DUF898 family)
MTDTLALDPASPPEMPAASLPAAEPPAANVEAFRFTGEAREYFRIWIVNLFLSVITLGLYSPWAKVRKKRYFHGNTWIAGANFEYHGNPISILKGRLLAFAAFAVYTLVSHFSERTADLLLLAMLPALPWLLVQSFAFNAANTSYRNIRFRFSARYGQALAAVAPIAAVPLVGLLAPDVDPGDVSRDVRTWWTLLLGPVLFFLVYPYVIAKVKLLHVRSSRFGAAAFECDAGVGRFYRIYLAGAFVFMGIMTIAGFVLAFSMGWSPFLAMGIGMGTYLLGGAVALGYVNSTTANYLFGATRLRGAGAFRSRLTVGGLTRIYLGNLLAIAITCGLAVPWAAVRIARYRAEHLALEVDGDIDRLTAADGRDVAATGEEMGELFGVDLSL